MCFIPGVNPPDSTLNISGDGIGRHDGVVGGLERTLGVLIHHRAFRQPPAEILVCNGLDGGRGVDKRRQFRLVAVSRGGGKALTGRGIFQPVQRVSEVASGVLRTALDLQRNVAVAPEVIFTHQRSDRAGQHGAEVDRLIETSDCQLCNGGRNEFLQCNEFRFGRESSVRARVAFVSCAFGGARGQLRLAATHPLRQFFPVFLLFSHGVKDTGLYSRPSTCRAKDGRFVAM